MKSIDFLPDVYRQRDALQRARLWWMTVVVMFGGMIMAAALGQAWLRHSLVEQLDSLAPEFAAAQARVQELAALQTQVARAGQEASLYTLLQSPWPRTQLLAEVVRPLNESIQLTRLALTEEELAKTALPSIQRNDKQAEDAAAKASAAEKDLTRLQEESDRRQTAIEIEGHTDAVQRLHDYVSQLNRSPLIATATIKSLETATSAHQNRTRFTLRLLVKRSYCQPNDAPSSVAGGGQ